MPTDAPPRKANRAAFLEDPGSERSSCQATRVSANATAGAQATVVLQTLESEAQMLAESRKTIAFGTFPESERPNVTAAIYNLAGNVS